MNTTKLIAITGGIGSGKSCALEIINSLGYKTLSSDAIVKELYDNIEVRKLLKPLFPTAVSGEDYSLDKKAIADLAFNDKSLHIALTELITPMVMAEIFKRTANATGLIFVEVPLLFECEFTDMFDGVLVIVRDMDERIKSLIMRSNLTIEQVKARIDSQFDYENSDLSSYTVIKNDGTKQSLKEKIILSIKEF
jgi:dephospho-CoA kinase